MVESGHSNKFAIQWMQAQLAATHFRRDKQQVLTVRPELVEGSFMVRKAHHERLNFKLSRLKWVAQLAELTCYQSLPNDR